MAITPQSPDFHRTHGLGRSLSPEAVTGRTESAWRPLLFGFATAGALAGLGFVFEPWTMLEQPQRPVVQQEEPEIEETPEETVMVELPTLPTSFRTKNRQFTMIVNASLELDADADQSRLSALRPRLADAFIRKMANSPPDVDNDAVMTEQVREVVLNASRELLGDENVKRVLIREFHIF